MQKKELSFKQDIIRNVLSKKLGNDEACILLTCTKRTLGNYLRKVTEGGLEALKDKRGGNHRKLTHKQELMLVVAKKVFCIPRLTSGGTNKDLIFFCFFKATTPVQLVTPRNRIPQDIQATARIESGANHIVAETRTKQTRKCYLI